MKLRDHVGDMSVNGRKMLKCVLMKDVRHVDGIHFVPVAVPMNVGKSVAYMWYCYLPNKDCSMEFVALAWCWLLTMSR